MKRLVEGESVAPGTGTFGTGLNKMKDARTNIVDKLNVTIKAT